jgi:plastocyanin
MRRSFWILATVIAVGAALASVAPVQAGGGCHESATEDATNSVELRNMCFGPTVTHVDEGAEVEFVNRDDMTHNIVGLGARWGEFEGMNGGETRRFTFTEAGIHPYACTLHLGMVGAVVVGDDARQAGDVNEFAAAAPARGPGDSVATSDARLPLAALVVVALVLGAAMALSRRSGRRSEG